MAPIKIIIIGAGIAGPTLALLLKPLNITCVLYEVRETPTTLGGALNITCNGLRILDRIGVYKQLEAICAETPEFEVYNASGSRVAVLKSGILTKERTGYGTMRVMRTTIQEILLQRLRDEGITVKNGMHLTKIDESAESVTATFADGTRDTGDILIGADEIHSAVRSIHVDPGFEPEYTGLSALYSITLFESLTSPLYFSGNFGTVLFHKGMFGTGFCDRERTKIYWFNSHTVPARDRDGWIAHGKEAEAIRSQLRERVEEINIPLVHEILEKSPEIRFYPIYQLPLKGKWFTKKTLLIADAAHAVAPSIGQGSSMALEDAYLLYRLFQEDIDVQTVFRMFDDIRRPRLEKIWSLSKQGGDIRRETGSWKQWIKEWLLWAWLRFMPERWMASPFEYDITTVQIMPTA